MKLSLPRVFVKLSKRERLTLTVGIALVVVVYFATAVFSPLSRSRTLSEQIRFEEELIRRSLIVIANRDRLVKEKDAYSSFLSEDGTEEKETNQFLKEMENLAKGSYVYLVNVRPAGMKKQGRMRQYMLEIDLEGKMEDIFKFFYAIETSKGLLKTERFQLRPKTERSAVTAASIQVSKLIVPK